MVVKVIYFLFSFLSFNVNYFFFRYWALAAPCYMVFCIVFLLIFYVALNFTLTIPLNSINTITGEQCNIPMYTRLSLCLYYIVYTDNSLVLHFFQPVESLDLFYACRCERVETMYIQFHYPYLQLKEKYFFKSQLIIYVGRPLLVAFAQYLNKG